MTMTFRKEEEWTKFNDSQGKLIERKTEVRFDPLTGESSRIIFDPGFKPTPPDYTEVAIQTGGAKCPFCPENLLKMTPVFLNEITEEGRIFQGEATVFPNLFPYSKHNGVVIFSDQHYIQLKEFTTALIKDAFIAAQTYIKRVIASDSEARYASINWNYLPQSGGSVLHPHIQPTISNSPTNYQSLLNERAKSFEGDKDCITALYELEKANRERWIGEIGNVAWMHAYAPKGQNDFIAIFPNKYSIDEITGEDWVNFAEGLKVIFATMEEQGFASFNMSLNVSIDSEFKQAVHARLIPRFTVGMLDTSDMNFFQALHGEALSFKVPEEVAAKARVHFQNRC